MIEKPLFFKNGEGKDLFGIFYLPSDQQLDKGIILCQPIAEEKVITKRIFVNLAKLLASKGYCVLLFDYFGEGDSCGSFEEATIESRINDIIVAKKVLLAKANVSKVGFIGLRLGATLATLAHLKEKCDFLVLWQPAVNGKVYFAEWLKSNYASQLVLYSKIVTSKEKLIKKILDGVPLEIEGYIVGKKFYEELIQIDLLKNAWEFFPTSLIIEILKDINTNTPLIQPIYEQLGHSKICFKRVNKNFDWNNMRFYNPYPEELFKETLEWLKQLNN